MDRPQIPSDAAVVLMDKEVREAGQVRALTPTVDALASAAKVPVRIEKNAFGREEKVATVPTKMLLEAMKPAWRKDLASQGEIQSRRVTETLKDKDGRERKVWNVHAKQVAETAGLVPAWRAGGVKVVRGENGNLWRQDGRGGWEDTGRTCLTRPLFEDGERVAPAGIVH